MVVAACVKDARPSRWLAPLERPRWPQHKLYALSRVACTAAMGRLVVGVRSAPERCGSGSASAVECERLPKGPLARFESATVCFGIQKNPLRLDPAIPRVYLRVREIFSNTKQL